MESNRLMMAADVSPRRRSAGPVSVWDLVLVKLQHVISSAPVLEKHKQSQYVSTISTLYEENVSNGAF